MYKHLIFDLDGTLLDTIEDIAFAISEALRVCGYSRRFDKQSAQRLIGNGADRLLWRALDGLSDDPEDFARLKAVYMPFYKQYQGIKCVPFPKMEKTLQNLREMGVDFAIVSNKPDDLSKIIIAQKLPQIPFALVLGHVEGNPVKPDPLLVDLVLEKTGWLKEDCCFVGDSYVDIDTGNNAGIDTALCCWGYGVYTDELKARSNHVLEEVSDLLALCKPS